VKLTENWVMWSRRECASDQTCGGLQPSPVAISDSEQEAVIAEKITKK